MSVATASDLTDSEDSSLASMVKAPGFRLDVTTIQVSPGYGTGKTIEVRYLDAKVIGNGSFGVVYVATLYDSREKVAIKKVKQDKRFKGKFYKHQMLQNRELQIMRKLEHPNIVKLLYYHYTKELCGDEYLNLILEFMPKTLFQLNKAINPIPDFYIKLYMFQLFRGLAYMHLFGICHRDIKPQNLLVDPEYGVLKICDFGSAKVLNQNENSVAYICSRYYRAPELVYGATEYTAKIDVWSGGTVLAELFLHQPIFRGESASTQINAIIKVLGTPRKDELKAMNPLLKDKEYPKIKPWPLSKLIGPQCPHQAIDLMTKVFQYNPAERPHSIEILAHPFFDSLRKPTLQCMPNGNLMPRLFDWFEKEFNIRPDLNRKIHPRSPKKEGNDDEEEEE